MPRYVDPVARRKDIAEAVWRVIHRDGVDGASVRAVAREAGLSSGSLRHYFATQNELLAFTMQLVTDRVRTRIQAIAPSSDVRAYVEAVLAELLPLDAERLSEMEIWLAFTGQGLIDPTLRTLRAESAQLMLGVCHRLLAELITSGDVDPGLDLELEAERLHAVLDGIALHALTMPERVTPDVMRGVIGAHLTSLGTQQ
ncbi:TetR/AcrR family transcriptional regulator [Pengzhenrongella phosphoraccumulans]|uniref:TetR/AcrR family transcriptional regulator n=1 Tax=Pengzhenrongella phosphoraccumulans TaxID=3114394 RepID=UPI00389046D4